VDLPWPYRENGFIAGLITSIASFWEMSRLQVTTSYVSVIYLTVGAPVQPPSLQRSNGWQRQINPSTGTVPMKPDGTVTRQMDHVPCLTGPSCFAAA